MRRRVVETAFRAQGQGALRKRQRFAKLMRNIYTNLGDRAQAERCFSSAASRYERFGNKNGVALATGNLAELFRIEERYDESIAASARVLTLYARAKDLKGLANTHLSIANVHITRGEWQQAE